jgi:two-component system, LytTR family, response regulator
MSSRLIRTLLVDDEPLANAGLRALLTAHPDIEVLGEARGGREAIRAIPEMRPDLVFLDVQMPKVDGFAVLREVEAETIPAIIFVTAYEEFAVRAFEVNALDYLVKPITAERLHTALDRVRHSLEQAQQGALAERLRSLLEEQPQPKTAYASRIVVRVGNRQLLLPVSDVDWVEADDYCSIIHARGTSHVIRETLGSLAARLDPATFARVHRSAIVNVARVRELRRQRLGNLAAVLADGTTVPISRSRRAQLAERLGGAR